MIRILHILDHSLPLHSGYTFRTRAILESQQVSGLEVRGITGQRHTADGPLVEKAGRLIFHRTPGTSNGPAGLREWREVGAFSQAIERIATQWRPDILHAHSPALCGHAALHVSRKLGIPVVYEIRAFWEDAAVGNGTSTEGSLKYRMVRAWENRVVARADAVITICRGLRDDLIARGCDGEKIDLSPNGVDLSLFGNPPPREDSFAARLGIASDAPIIGFIGSFYDYEGLDDLIAAMPYLQERQPHAQLLLVGGGPCEAALRAQASASSAAGAIHFTGRVPHREVERYYSLMDILAYPRKASRLTHLVTPLKPLEAMAQRRIVAASDVGGHRELMIDGDTAMLFPADDPAGCARALAHLYDNRDGWDAMRERGRAHIAKNHDWSQNIYRYQKIYHRLLTENNNRSMATAS